VARLTDLVDFVDVEHAALGRFQVEVGRMKQFQQQVLDILADVARFGQRGRVADGKRYVQDAGQRAGEQRFARTRRPDHQDVRLFDIDVVPFEAERQPLVVVVNGYGQNFLRRILPDDVAIELRHDFARRRNAVKQRFGAAAAALFLVQNRLAQFDALATDVNIARPLDERTNVAVALAAERAEGVLFGRAGATTPSAQILSCGHVVSFRPATTSLPAAASNPRCAARRPLPSRERWRAS
jgi:hypothetical protein